MCDFNCRYPAYVGDDYDCGCDNDMQMPEYGCCQKQNCGCNCQKQDCNCGCQKQDCGCNDNECGCERSAHNCNRHCGCRRCGICNCFSRLFGCR